MASETSFGQPNGNTPGRPPGTKNKIGRDFQEAYEEAKRQGYKHPYLIMMQWAHDESKPLEVRGAMIKECASYTCTKPKKTVEVQVPVLSTIEQAEAFLATLAAENDLDPVELAAMVRHWIESKRGGQELDIKRAPQLPQQIQITGGMPDMPGTSILMPMSNGHLNGKAIEHEPPALTESVASEAGDP